MKKNGLKIDKIGDLSGSYKEDDEPPVVVKYANLNISEDYIQVILENSFASQTPGYNPQDEIIKRSFQNENL